MLRNSASAGGDRARNLKKSAGDLTPCVFLMPDTRVDSCTSQTFQNCPNRASSAYTFSPSLKPPPVQVQKVASAEHTRPGRTRARSCSRDLLNSYPGPSRTPPYAASFTTASRVATV